MYIANISLISIRKVNVQVIILAVMFNIINNKIGAFRGETKIMVAPVSSLYLLFCLPDAVGQ